MDAPIAAVISTTIVTAKPYFELFFKGSAKQIGAMFSESAGLWRLENRLRILKKAKELCDERSVKPEKLLPDVLIPLMEAAGDTDDPVLSDMFAGLLANNLDPARQNDVHPAFAKVGNQLAPLDARILELIDASYRIMEETKGVSSVPCTHLTLGNQIGRTWPAFELNIQNLERLGLLKASGPGTEWKGSCWNFTAFGLRFLSACSKGKYWRDAEWERTLEHIAQVEKNKLRTANSASNE